MPVDKDGYVFRRHDEGESVKSTSVCAMTKEVLNSRRKFRLSMEGVNFRSKMQMHKLSIKSWVLSGLRERKKWREGGCWCLYTMQKHLAGPVIGAWIGGSMASVCLPACVRGMGDGSVCTYPTSCAPASKAEEFRQVLQVIEPSIFHDTPTMPVRIPVAIKLVDGTLRRS